MSYNSKSFGIVISRIRTERGISQTRLADMASIARSHLNMLENGRKTVRLDTFVRIAEALDMNPSELMLLVENENQHNSIS